MTNYWNKGAGVPPMQGVPELPVNYGNPNTHPGGPRGQDTIPAWLSPNEYVVNAEAVEAVGVPTLEAINDVGLANKDGGFINNKVEKLMGEGYNYLEAYEAALRAAGHYNQGGSPMPQDPVRQLKKYTEKDRYGNQVSYEMGDNGDIKKMTQKDRHGAMASVEYAEVPPMEGDVPLHPNYHMMPSGDIMHDSEHYNNGGMVEPQYAFLGQLFGGSEAQPTSDPIDLALQQSGQSRHHYDIYGPNEATAAILGQGSVPAPAGDIPVPMSPAETLIKQQEGYRDDVYLDTMGNPTAGYGHLLGADSGYGVGDTVGQSQADEWFVEDFESAQNAARKNIKNYDELPREVQAALVSHAYQLGQTGQGEFKKMVDAIEKGDLGAAADEVMKSSFAEQTPSRAEHLSTTLAKFAGGGDVPAMEDPYAEAPVPPYMENLQKHIDASKEAGVPYLDGNTVVGDPSQWSEVPPTPGIMYDEATGQYVPLSSEVRMLGEAADEGARQAEVLARAGEPTAADIIAGYTTPEDVPAMEEVPPAPPAPTGDARYRPATPQVIAENRGVAEPTEEWLARREQTIADKKARKQKLIEDGYGPGDHMYDANERTIAELERGLEQGRTLRGIEDTQEGIAAEVEAGTAAAERRRKVEGAYDKYADAENKAGRTPKSKEAWAEENQVSDVLVEPKVRTPEDVSNLVGQVDTTLSKQGATDPASTAESNAISSQQTPENVEKTGEQAPEADKNSATSFMQSIFGDLFDMTELKRMGIMYLGSRLLGYSHGGSLQWAAKNYVNRVDTKVANQQTRIQELIKGGKYTAASIEKYKKSGDVGDLISVDAAKGTSVAVPTTSLGGILSESALYVGGDIGQRVDVFKGPGGKGAYVIPPGIDPTTGQVYNTAIPLATYKQILASQGIRSTKYIASDHSADNVADEFAKVAEAEIKSINANVKDDGYKFADNHALLGGEAQRIYSDMLNTSGAHSSRELKQQIGLAMQDYLEAKSNAGDQVFEGSLEPFVRARTFQLDTKIPQRLTSATDPEQIMILDQQLKRGVEAQPGTTGYAKELREDSADLTKLWNRIESDKTQREIWDGADGIDPFVEYSIALMNPADPRHAQALETQKKFANKAK